MDYIMVSFDRTTAWFSYARRGLEYRKDINFRFLYDFVRDS